MVQDAFFKAERREKISKEAKKMSDKVFRPYEAGQNLLMPSSLGDWLPEDHLAYFISDVVERSLDVSPIIRWYEERAQGQPAYHPVMMVKLLLYAYSTGVASSRRMERETRENVAFRVLCAGSHPDHSTISVFRQTHLTALGELFIQVLRLCREAGLVRLGHVALDGTKVKANASKHKAMSYGRMVEKEGDLEWQVVALLAGAQQADEEEDRRHGQGVRGDELPEELRRRETRLLKIREAKERLEERARERARGEAQEKAREAAKVEPEIRTAGEEAARKARPKDKDQDNFTDPESRIMKDGATKSFEQAYNAQAAVDEEAQVIVACEVTQEANDKKQIEPMVAAIRENLSACNAQAGTGEAPEKLSADSGYFSEENVKTLQAQGIDPYVCPDRLKHGDEIPAGRGPLPKDATFPDRMRRKLRTKEGRAVYKRRKAIVEPVFGQIKEARGFRRFLLRGLGKVRQEWRLICLSHNLLKLYRAGAVPVPA